ncbi:MAG: N-acetylmuramoyl-L-alanine amidase [Chloroflexota bacterium]
MVPNLVDVRSQMPNYENYKDWDRGGAILGIAFHHSATADRQTGQPTGDAFSYFDYHVNGRGWAHGGYNYVINADGVIQYALDEKIAAYHAGFKDVDNSEGLEYGQYWNNHYLAICVAGWFSDNRTYRDDQGTHSIPNNDTRPRQAQFDAMMALIVHLREKYNIPVENVRAHRELTGNATQCPGLNMDPAQIRQLLRENTPAPPIHPIPSPGEHVILIPDTNDYLNVSLTYIWKFQPDVSFAPQVAAGRWKYVTAIGPIGDDLLSEYRQRGATIVDHIQGEPAAVSIQLDDLVFQDERFLPSEPPPASQPQTYVVQPGDSLTKIAAHFYDDSRLWPVIFAANRDQLVDPSRIRVGMVLTIPPKP